VKAQAASGETGQMMVSVLARGPAAAGSKKIHRLNRQRTAIGKSKV